MTQIMRYFLMDVFDFLAKSCSKIVYFLFFKWRKYICCNFV